MLTSEVARFLLEYNGTRRFAACGIDPQGEIVVVYSLFADELSKEGLSDVVKHIAYGAEHLDNELSMRFR